MNTNGPKPSQDPRYNPSEASKSPGNESASRPSEPSPSPRPYSIEPTSIHAEPKSSYQDSGKQDDRDFQKSTTEHIKSATEQAGEKLKSTFRSLKDSRQVDDLYNYAVTNKEKTITYILLGIGLFILLFVNDIVGGLVIGLLAGYYYSREIVYFIRNLPTFFEGQDQLRYIVLVTLLLGLLLAAPGIIIGAAVVAAFKQIIYKEPEPTEEDFRPKPNGKSQGNQGNQGNQRK